MNQFYSSEFSANLEQESNNFIRTGVPSLSMLFPVPVNMHNLQYIIEQPYSSFKLDQIRNNKKLILDKYCISNKELKQRFLVNNVLTYEKNFEERVRACQKEEEEYYNAEKDNMNYRINRANNNNEEQNDNNVEDDRVRDEDYNENYDNESDSSESERNNGRNNYSYNVENDSDISDESNMELNRDDLRIARALRNSRYGTNNINNASNSNWSQRLRRPIQNNNNVTRNNTNTNNQRISTRYNLRNHPNQNILNNNNIENNINFSNNNYNLRNRRELTNNEGNLMNNDYVMNNNENENNNVIIPTRR